MLPFIEFYFVIKCEYLPLQQKKQPCIHMKKDEKYLQWKLTWVIHCYNCYKKHTVRHTIHPLCGMTQFKKSLIRNETWISEVKAESSFNADISGWTEVDIASGFWQTMQ